MIELLQSVSAWAAWLGLGGIVGFLLLMLFAPALARVVGEFLSPIARAASEGIVWFFRDVLWVGMKDMLDNWASITFVIVAIFVGASLLAPKSNCDKKVERAVAAQMADLRTKFKFVPLTPAEKKARAKQKRQAEPCWYCLW
jgi:hypothetical protein